MEIEIISQVNPKNSSSNPRDKTHREKAPSSAPHRIVLEKDKQDPPITDKEIHKMIQQLKEDMQHYNKKLRFIVNKEINRVVVKVIDKNTDKVIKEIPPVEIQNMIASIRRSLGLLVDKQI